MSLGEGLGVGFRRVVEGGLHVEENGKGEGGGRVGGGVGTDKGTGKSMQTLSKLPFSNLPLSFSPKDAHTIDSVKLLGEVWEPRIWGGYVGRKEEL